jgi:hypothetical protein
MTTQSSMDASERRSALRRLTGRLAAAAAVLVACAPASAIPIYNPANGHSYEAFLARDITWADASAAATAKGGYLATLTSAAENQWVFENVVAPAFGTDHERDVVQAWLGGYQKAGGSEPDGGWKWVTGEKWSYTNWLEGEPNNSLNIESHLTINRLGTAQWNDEGAWVVRGYLVEYSKVPDGGATALLLAASIGILSRFRHSCARKS